MSPLPPQLTEILARIRKGSDGRVNRWSFYNAITSYLSVANLKPVLDAWMQNKAQKVLTTPFAELTEELVKVEVER